MAISVSAETISWVADVAAVEKAVVDAEGSTHLVAISPDVGEGDALQIAEFTSRVSPATAVVLVRSTNLNGSLPRFIRAGVRDVVDLSTGRNELSQSLSRALEWAASVHGQQSDHKIQKEKVGSIITVFGSKGGAGKTFLACNLAAALAQRTGRETALIDLDFGSSDVFSYYGADPRHTLEDLFAPGGLEDKKTIVQSGTELAPRLWGFGSPADPTLEPIPASGVGKILRGLQMNFDFVVVDGPAQYTDQMLAALDAADAICLVASLDVVGVRHLVKAFETLMSIGVPKDVVRTVLNRADSKVGLETADVEKVTGMSIDIQIPSSRMVPTSLNKGTPLFVEAPKSAVAASIAELSDNLMADLIGNVSEPAEHSARKRRLFSRGA